MPVISEKYKNENSKQPTTICSLGADKIFRSPLEQFHKSFVAKRAMRTLFSLVGESKRDERKSFAFMLRHTFSGGANASNLQYWNRGVANEPAGDASTRCFDSKLLIPARIAKSSHTLTYFGQNLSTDDRRLEPMTNGDAVVYDEWKSPFNLQCMEDLSWNLNRYKVLPYGITGTAIQNKFTSGMQLPVAATEADGSFKQQDLYTSKYTEADDVVTFSPYLTPMPVLTDVVHAPRESESQMRTVLKTFAPANNEHNTHLGHYKAQISRGTLYSTFVNTCDSKLIVDLVVHSVKNNHAISGAAGKPTADKSVTKHIWDTYARNWKDRTDRNKSDFLIGKQDFKEFDVITDPKTKFLPSSCRLPKYTINSGHVVAGHNADHIHHGKIHDHEAPKFVEVERKQMTVMPGKRRTIAINLPAETWDPLKVTYGADPYVLLNELGYHLSWSVCGAKARTIIEPGEDNLAVGVKVIGQHHAPSTFKVIGRYYENVLPAVCIDPDNYDMLSLDIEAEYRVDESANVDVYSASFVDASARDVDGRYVRLHTDGEKRAKQSKLLTKRKIDKVQQDIEEAIDVEPAEINPQSPQGQHFDSTIAQVTPSDNAHTKTSKRFKKMQALAWFKKTGKVLFEHGSNLLHAAGMAEEKIVQAQNTLEQSIPYVRYMEAVFLMGVAIQSRNPALLETSGPLLVEGATAGGLEVSAAELTAFNAAADSNPTLVENIVPLLTDGEATAYIGEFPSFTEAQLNAIGTETELALPYGSTIGDMSLIDRRRLHDDGTEVVYVDHDPSTDGIQQPDSQAIDVNVTNFSSIQFVSGTSFYTNNSATVRTQAANILANMINQYRANPYTGSDSHADGPFWSNGVPIKVKFYPTNHMGGTYTAGYQIVGNGFIQLFVPGSTNEFAVKGADWSEVL